MSARQVCKISYFYLKLQEQGTSGCGFFGKIGKKDYFFTNLGDYSIKFINFAYQEQPNLSIQHEKIRIQNVSKARIRG